MCKKAFIIAFANSSQYGNDFFISPKARIDDGFLDLVIIDDIPQLSAAKFLYRFTQSNLDHSRHVETHRFKEMTVQHPYMRTHIDGEETISPQSKGCV